jgi:cytochrome c2
MKRFAIAALAAIASLSPASAQLGDAARGRQNFRACAPCHSLEPDRNMTGPSLANLWGRKAGSLPSFERYSEALKASGIIWDDRSLDGWLTDPNRMVPDNEMPFNGIKDTGVRADLLAFLKDATKPGAPQQTAQQGGMKGMGGMMGGMRGMMGEARTQILKNSNQEFRSKLSPTAMTPIASPLPTAKRERSGSATCASRPTPARTGRIKLRRRWCQPE